MNNNRISIAYTFKQITTQLDHYFLFQKKQRLSYHFIKMLYKLFGSHINTKYLNYDRIAPSFNQVYFKKNLLKNLIYFNHHLALTQNGIIDVGCGAAPASIAIASLLNNNGFIVPIIKLIDKSQFQLNIANELTKLLSIKIQSFCKRSFEVENKTYNELVVFSYFFCEQKKIFLQQLFNNRHNFNNGFVIIDYYKNIKEIENYFIINGDNKIKCDCFHYSLPDNILNGMHLKEIYVYGCHYRP